MVIGLFALIIIDYLSGIISSIYKKEFKSKIATNGLLRKSCVLLAILVSYIIENMMCVENLTNISCALFSISEITSIIENFKKCDVDFTFILKYIKKEK